MSQVLSLSTRVARTIMYRVMVSSGHFLQLQIEASCRESDCFSVVEVGFFFP